MAKITGTRYSAGSKLFHWLIAIIVISMLSFSFFLDDIPEQYQSLAYMIHKSIGLTILCLMIMRLVWIHHAGKPALPKSVPMWQRFVARTVQYSLYIFLLAMPMTGWIMSVAANRTPTFFGLFNVPLPIAPDEALAKFMNQTHTIIAWILIALIVLHIAGALKHYFIDKDHVLQSMLPGKEPINSISAAPEQF